MEPEDRTPSIYDGIILYEAEKTKLGEDLGECLRLYFEC